VLILGWAYCRVEFWELGSPALEYGPVFKRLFGWFSNNHAGRCSVSKVIIVRKNGGHLQRWAFTGSDFFAQMTSCRQCIHLAFDFRCGSGSFVNMDHDSSRGRWPSLSCAASEALSCTDVSRATAFHCRLWQPPMLMDRIDAILNCHRQ
jgi:hypothetical protein